MKTFRETLLVNTAGVSGIDDQIMSLFAEANIDTKIGRLFMESLMDDISKIGGEIGEGLKTYLLGIHTAEKKLSMMSNSDDIAKFIEEQNRIKTQDIVGFCLILGSYAVTMTGVITINPIIITIGLAFQLWIVGTVCNESRLKREDLKDNFKTSLNIIDEGLEKAHKKNDKYAIQALNDLRGKVVSKMNEYDII